MSTKVSPVKTIPKFHIGQRVSYDGSLCTVRWIGQLPATKGEWLGVEWDDPTRGKHDGIYQGKRIFECLNRQGNPASFLRPTRASDLEKTVLEAIKSKYGDAEPDEAAAEAVVISGKVAEEVGFAKVAQEQARLSDLKIVLIDHFVVSGIAPRGSSRRIIEEAQKELAEVCPNIEELELGFNVIENWQDVADICSALPKLTQLSVGGLRLSSFNHALGSKHFSRVKHLYSNECLMTSFDISRILIGFTSLQVLDLANNQLKSLNGLNKSITKDQFRPLPAVHSVYLDNNEFQDLDCMLDITKAFPNARTISLGSNKISELGQKILTSQQIFSQIDALSLESNQITSIRFLDTISTLFPKLTSLRVSGNPFYTVKTGDNDPKATDKLFYLSLARIPTLKQLNFGQTTTKDREEGEIYYLSIIGQDIQTFLTSNTAETHKTSEELTKHVTTLYPRYQPLCEKYARESVIDQFFSSTPDPSSEQKGQTTQYPSGSLGARLVTATFYIPASHVSSSPSITERIPLSLPVMSLMARLRRYPAFRGHLAPLQFNLIYESTEFDPVDTTAESTTRSKVYARGYRPSKEERENLWKEWGDWDADALVEEELEQRAMEGKDGSAATVETNGKARVATEEHWTESGVLMRDGREWKRREVSILHSVRRPWGDWIDIASGGPEREVRVRIEPFERPKWK